MRHQVAATTTEVVCNTVQLDLVEVVLDTFLESTVGQNSSAVAHTADLLAGPIYYRWLLSATPLTVESVDAVVTLTLKALKP